MKELKKKMHEVINFKLFSRKFEVRVLVVNSPPCPASINKDYNPIEVIRAQKIFLSRV